MSTSLNGYRDRRQFLQGVAAVAGGLAVPRRRPEDPGRNLVLLQLSGGNDGLSTVVPYAHDGYASARSSLRYTKDQLLPLDEGRGWNPKLTEFRKAWDAGQLALVEGLGYPEGTRSHFMSFEVWHTARRAGRASGEGWVGRLASAGWEAKDVPERVVHLGKKAPYSLVSSVRPAVSLQSPTSFRWFGTQQDTSAYVEAAQLRRPGERDPRYASRDAALEQIRGLLDDAQRSSARIRATALRYRAGVEYPRTRLGASLQDAAAIIHGELGTRVISIDQDGFDLHASQRAAQESLLDTVDKAVGAFLKDLGRSEAGRNTVVLAFSEFGRRVQENGSKGTDHGKAGPAFVLGHRVQGGAFGQQPSLSSLDAEGDLVFTTDFRSVYATLLERALGVGSLDILGRDYPRLGFLG